MKPLFEENNNKGIQYLMKKEVLLVARCNEFNRDAFEYGLVKDHSCCFAIVHRRQFDEEEVQNLGSRGILMKCREEPLYQDPRYTLIGVIIPRDSACFSDLYPKIWLGRASGFEHPERICKKLVCNLEILNETNIDIVHELKWC